MVWTKIVRVVSYSACPICDNGGFELEPGEHMDDLNPLVKCVRCGHVARTDDFRRPVRREETKLLPPPEGA